jgi:hypothetical protein
MPAVSYGTPLNRHKPDKISRFELCWLAEAVRLHELDRGLAAYPDLPLLEVDANGAQQQDWVLQRSRFVARYLGLASIIQSWRRHAGVLMAVLIVLAMVSGVVAALGFFGAEQRQVNVLWTLLGLIGVNFIALCLWLLSGRLSGGGVGKLWFWALARWPAATVDAAPVDVAQAGKALAFVLGRRGLGRWGLSVVSHSAWLLALLCSFITMLLALSLRSYSFVIETTILPPEFFAGFIHGFGWLPAQLGFAVPDADMIVAALAGSGGEQSEQSRRAWASWLSGGLIIYGILPRLLVWSFSVLRLAHLHARLDLDLSRPGYAELLHPFAVSGVPGVVDAAPPRPVTQRVALPHRVKSRRTCLAALELGTDIVWPPCRANKDGLEIITEPVDSREQRRALLARLKQDPPARLLMACDLRQSPDRGTLALLIEASRHAGMLGVWLVHSHDSESRLAVWRESLGNIGLPDACILLTTQGAMDWLHKHE